MRPDFQKIPLACIGLFLAPCAVQAATISGNVADYNAAQVGLAGGVLVVPVNLVTYTASSTLALGSQFTVTLPAGFTFGTAPSLTDTGASTFNLSAGGVGAQFATFTVASAPLLATQSISLATFTVDGATALDTVTPVANALPVTLQAIGTDLSPLSFPAFASDVGAYAPFVGAIQFIDTNPPSNSTEFYGSPDSLTAVIAATAIGPQTADAATGTVPILSPNGLADTLSIGDTATVTIFGNFGGIAQAFTDLSSNCTTPLAYGTVLSGSAIFQNVPVGVEVFFCVTGSGQTLQPQPNGYSETVSPGTSTDFLSAAVDIEFAGETCDGFGGGFGFCTVPSSMGEAYQVRYFANLNAGESYIDIVNYGGNGDPALGPGFGANNFGNLCVNVYAIAPDEELVGCCACLLTPDQVAEVRVNADLLSGSSTIAGGLGLTSLTVKLVSSSPAASNCSTSAAQLNVATVNGGFVAFGTTLQAVPGNTYQTIETPFSIASLSAAEEQSLSGRCAEILGNGSGYGICGGCAPGALGAAKK